MGLSSLYIDFPYAVQSAQNNFARTMQSPRMKLVSRDGGSRRIYNEIQFYLAGLLDRKKCNCGFCTSQNETRGDHRNGLSARVPRDADLLSINLLFKHSRDNKRSRQADVMMLM